jgi:excisionase family DNA binding protein
VTSVDIKLASERSRITLSPAEAAAALGVSRDFFDKHIGPELRIVRRGRLKLIPVKELERWVEREAALTWDDA